MFSIVSHFDKSEINSKHMHLHIFFTYHSLIISYSKIDTDSEKLAEFKKYCSASYHTQTQENNMSLKKLILFHRHGDRAPHIIANTNWNTKKCRKSVMHKNNIQKCIKVKCENGLLTEKGYNQMIKLGKFIKMNYPKKLFKKIKTRSTAIERTKASLHGVYYGLMKENVVNKVVIKKLENDSLIIPIDCPFIEERIKAKMLPYNIPFVIKDDKRGNTSFKIRSDQYFTALCNDIKFDCDKINCNQDIIFQYLHLSNDSWREEANILMNDEEILIMVFGRFVDELKEIINDNSSMHIISVHDKSLAMLMAGLGIKETEHPPYASAIFMELWEDQYNEEFVRIIYNDTTCKTIIDENCNISLEKFINYIDVLHINEDDMLEKCKIQIFKKTPKLYNENITLPKDDKNYNKKSD